MGSGKTAVGQALAKKLNRKFIELDSLIEQKAGKPGCRSSSVFEYYPNCGKHQGKIHGDYKRIKQFSWFSVLLNSEFPILMDIFNNV